LAAGSVDFTRHALRRFATPGPVSIRLPHPPSVFYLPPGYPVVTCFSKTISHSFSQERLSNKDLMRPFFPTLLYMFLYDLPPFSPPAVRRVFATLLLVYVPSPFLTGQFFHSFPLHSYLRSGSVVWPQKLRARNDPLRHVTALHPEWPHLHPPGFSPYWRSVSSVFFPPRAYPSVAFRPLLTREGCTTILGCNSLFTGYPLASCECFLKAGRNQVPRKPLDTHLPFVFVDSWADASFLLNTVPI